MSWLPGFFAPSAAWLFALTIPLVVFYFLKLRRVRLRVPSLVLWQRVLEDRRVNAPFQRFKRNILLLLQLLLLMLLVLAAMQPYVRGDDEAAGRLLVLVDRSASMGALDKAGGASRLDTAKKQLTDMIDALSPDEELAVIAFDRSARQMAPFTSNKRVLRQAVDAIEGVDLSSDLGDALRMAQAMGRTAGFDKVLLLTDGVIPGVADPTGKSRTAPIDFDLPFALDYQRLPAAGANIGITALEARRATGGGWNVLARVQANGPGLAAGVSATLELHQDGVHTASEPVTIDDAEGRRLVFTVATTQATALELRLVPTGFDALAADNRAYLRLVPARQLAVWCDPSLFAWRRALMTMKDVRLLPDEGAAADAAGVYDLRITDNDTDEPDASVTLRVGVIPPALRRAIRRSDAGDRVIDWRRDHPLVEHIQFGDVVLADRVEWADDQRDAALENLGYEAVVYGERGPLMLQRVTPTRAEYDLLFHTDRSTLPYRVGFPILARNIVQIAEHRAGLLERSGDRTGVLGAVEASAGASVTVDGPGGVERTLTADESGVVSAVAAPRAGWYTVRAGGSTVAQIGVSLLDVTETQGLAVDRLDLKEVDVAASSGAARTNRSLWPWLAMAALIVLCVEWWFFHHKPGGYA